MALPYRKWTEDEVKNRNVCAEGDYPFTLIEVVQKETKGKLNDKGQLVKKPMLELTLEFYDSNGQVKKQKDWIVFDEVMDWKLRHLANTTGLIDLYDNNALDATHLVRKKGFVSLGQKDDEYQGQKRKVNFVKDYIKKEDAIKQDNSFLDDDIPHM
jgi:hypothetical protein